MVNTFTHNSVHSVIVHVIIICLSAAVDSRVDWARVTEWTSYRRRTLLIKMESSNLIMESLSDGHEYSIT